MGGVSHPRVGLVSWKVTILIFSSVLSKLTPLPFTRYRFTATLISLILEGGYQSPHRTIDKYVEEFTCFRPTDGKDWSDREPNIPSIFIGDIVTKLGFDKMSESSCFLNLTVSNCINPHSPSIDPAQANTLCSALYDQVLYGQYNLDSFGRDEQNLFVEYGFARNKWDEPAIDEPLAILAALHWVNQITRFSMFRYLSQNIHKHFPRENGFEAYLIFYIRKVFESTPILDEIFAFRSDFKQRGGGRRRSPVAA
jgi:hypothetical protein